MTPSSIATIENVFKRTTDAEKEKGMSIDPKKEPSSYTGQPSTLPIQEQEAGGKEGNANSQAPTTDKGNNHP